MIEDVLNALKLYGSFLLVQSLGPLKCKKNLIERKLLWLSPSLSLRKVLPEPNFLDRN